MFNPDKLDWMNAQHLARLSDDDLISAVRPELARAGLWSPPLQGDRRAWLLRALRLVLPRVRRLGDFAGQLEPFLANAVTYDPAAVDKHLNTAGLEGHVSALADVFEGLTPFDERTSEEALRRLADARGVKAGALIHATRVALTGRAVSPGLFEVAALVGQPRVVARLRELERFLRARVG